MDNIMRRTVHLDSVVFYGLNPSRSETQREPNNGTVFRTLFDVDYMCVVDIVAETDLTNLLIVIRYPDVIALTCAVNSNAITVLKKKQCFRLCDYIDKQDSVRTIFPVKGRLRFLFISNSSVNTDMNAYLYQVTATAARLRPGNACYKRNETNCSVGNKHYCFTSGVVCDGIQNCGVDNWFDERKSLCGLPIEKLGYAPVIAVAAALLCTILAASHILLRCLPPRANSFFIFNANEDNRLCVDPVLKPHDSFSPQPERPKATSLVPVSSSSTSDSDIGVKENICSLGDDFKRSKPLPVSAVSTEGETQPSSGRKMTMRSVTAKIQEKLRLVTGSRALSTALPMDSLETGTTHI